MKKVSKSVIAFLLSVLLLNNNTKAQTLPSIGNETAAQKRKKIAVVV